MIYFSKKQLINNDNRPPLKDSLYIVHSIISMCTVYYQLVINA